MSDGMWRCVDVLNPVNDSQGFTQGYKVLEQHTTSGEYRKRIVNVE